MLRIVSKDLVQEGSMEAVIAAVAFVGLIAMWVVLPKTFIRR